ncbi:GyrI-like domain-containing protein [Flavobacterium sp. 3HN19-14]|uniref:GyrI-like domain-containing protein n=1 Tax=Flavobacterium sp. 3HN19-14 TaxID=3448133 RepID=UPI003EE017E0
MLPRITTITEMKLAGMRLTMSFSENKTFQLWSNFMPRKKEITNAVGTELYSVQIYANGFFSEFNPNSAFEKSAAVAVADFEDLPSGMNQLIIEPGLYAVFDYKGNPTDAQEFYQSIFQIWLPASGYEPDYRPYFEILGERYKNNHPESEEEIWIPVKFKNH